MVTIILNQDGKHYIAPFNKIHSISEQERIVAEKGPGQRIYSYSELDESIQEKIKSGELPSCNSCGIAKRPTGGYCGPMVDYLVFYDENGKLLCDDYQKQLKS